MSEPKRPRRNYAPEFKKDTAALVKEQNYTIPNAARAVDVSQNVVRRWVREAEQESGGEALNTDERAELVRLRKENNALRMEKEILKKASAFFAKEMR